MDQMFVFHFKQTHDIFLCVKYILFLEEKKGKKQNIRTVEQKILVPKDGYSINIFQWESWHASKLLLKEPWSFYSHLLLGMSMHNLFFPLEIAKGYIFNTQTLTKFKKYIQVFGESKVSSSCIHQWRFVSKGHWHLCASVKQTCWNPWACKINDYGVIDVEQKMSEVAIYIESRHPEEETIEDFL